MKISKEYVLVVIVGLFLLAYLLDSVVNPLDLSLPTPYHYLQFRMMSQFPFTTASIFIKSIALFLTPIWLMSFVSKHNLGKASFLLVLASLVQLFALQDIITKAEVIPIEWSLSLSVAGLALLAQAALFAIKGVYDYLRENIGSATAIERLRQETNEVDE